MYVCAAIRIRRGRAPRLKQFACKCDGFIPVKTIHARQVAPRARHRDANVSPRDRASRPSLRRDIIIEITPTLSPDSSYMNNGRSARWSSRRTVFSDTVTPPRSRRKAKRSETNASRALSPKSQIETINQGQIRPRKACYAKTNFYDELNLVVQPC